MKVVASYSIKGGVGKTSASVNLATAAAKEGERVLLWDLDPQGAASFYFGVEKGEKGHHKRLFRGKAELDDAIYESHFENLDFIAADRSARRLDAALEDAKRPHKTIRKLLAPLADDYDVVVLDCPPTQSLIAEAILSASSAVLVPVIPSPLSVRALTQVRKLIESLDRQPPMYAFLSMVDRRRSLHRDLSMQLRADHPAFLPTAVPYAAVVERMGTERKPLAAFAESSTAYVAYRGLWVDLREALATT